MAYSPAAQHSGYVKYRMGEKLHYYNRSHFDRKRELGSLKNDDLLISDANQFS